MNDLHEKYLAVLKENEELKMRIKILENNLSSNSENKEKENNINENKNIYENKNVNEPDLKNILQNYIKTQKIIKKAIQSLLGFEIIIKNKTLIFRSIYAFNEDEFFIFEFENENFKLIENEYLKEFRKEVELYILKGKSLPAFLGFVTLELYGQKTMQ